ncbi:hypothetical protein D3C81_1470760 [compost metagenome]
MLSGVSLAANISFLFSFIVTSAALRSRLSEYPDATPARVFMLHGSIIIPSVLKVPLAMLASISFIEYTLSASAPTSSTLYVVSCNMVASAPLDITRWVSHSGFSFKIFKSSIPRIAPLAPLIPTTNLFFLLSIVFILTESFLSIVLLVLLINL